jgi:hypothetical protein
VDDEVSMPTNVHVRIKNTSVFSTQQVDQLRATLQNLGYDLGQIHEYGGAGEALPHKCGEHACDKFDSEGPTRCETEACRTHTCDSHGCDNQSCSTEACSSHICDIHEKSFAQLSQMTANNPTFAALIQALNATPDPEGGITLATAPA